MDSDDDGVILSNSPLYAHLTEAGFEFRDTDVAFAQTSDDRRPTLEKTCHLPRSKILSFMPNVLTLFSSGLCKAKSAVLHSFHNFDGEPFLDSILESPCLDEEDQRFLRNLLEARDLSVKKENFQGSFFTYSIAAAVVVCLVARCLSAERQSSAESLLVGIVACALLLVAGMILVKYCLLRQYRANIHSLLSTMQETQAMIRKCLQIIQEAEVVARGFTLASHNVPVHRIEMNILMPNLDPQRQCPELRRSVFLWTRELFLIGKSATLEAIESVPLEGELDVSTIYLACTAPEDVSTELFAPLGKALEEGTENFSLSALKAMLYLMYIQHSEFLRRLSLSLMPGIKKSCLFDALSLKTIVADLRASIQAQLRNLSNAYQFYKSSQMTEELESRPLRALQTAPHELHVAAHSLGLHLQAALKRTQAVESITESIGEDAEMESLEANLSCLLAEVKEELASSYSCLEEVSMLLDKRSAPKLPGESPTLELPPPVTSTGPVVVINEDDVPVIEDEVFEALLSDKVEPGDVEQGDDYDFPSQKKQKEASAVVFKELKSVLVIKAKEHREREKNALARSGVEGGHFDKLGFVVPEAEGPTENDGHVGDCSPAFEEGAAARSTTPMHKTAMGDECSESLEFQLSNAGESAKQEISEVPMHATAGFALPSSEGMCMPNPRNIALMAAIRSQQLMRMPVSTFEDGVSDSSSDENEQECDA
ncbi:vezatin [Dermacentor silvarum]|uniref:vezatin n=1 Tax=Dermacentor silvarum TaxID=543639 RepID=UPI0018998BCF|nr:vezatin [Dermacentor silvarum]